MRLVTGTSVAGYPVLRSPLAMEELGRGQVACSHDGPGHWNHLRSGEEAEEEASSGVSVRQPDLPQLVGVPLLPV